MCAFLVFSQSSSSKECCCSAGRHGYLAKCFFKPLANDLLRLLLMKMRSPPSWRDHFLCLQWRANWKYNGVSIAVSIYVNENPYRMHSLIWMTSVYVHAYNIICCCMNLLGVFRGRCASRGVQEPIYGESLKAPAGNMHVFCVAASSAFTNVPKDKCGLLKQDSHTLLTF